MDPNNKEPHATISLYIISSLKRSAVRQGTDKLSDNKNYRTTNGYFISFDIFSVFGSPERVVSPTDTSKTHQLRCLQEGLSHKHPI